MVVPTEISQESSSSSSSSTYYYDVFLSFRGVDTRYSFTDHLHKALLDANIETFFDDDEINIGNELKPELEDAIKASRASIIVLSENYASSTWCLEELLLILEQRTTSNHIVLPIFYNIKSIDVKKQQSSFALAMAKHKEKMEREPDAKKRGQLAEKIEQWKKALTQVAGIEGEETSGRRETILIERIIKEINRRLDLPKRSTIPKIIGMESSIRTITSFLKDGSSQTSEILTIWGMAGIGKTCLAEYIFQLHYLDFERSCFLHDIERRWTSPNGLLDLQKQLLKDIKNGSWVDIQSTSVGTFKIEKSLLRKRTLLILDDVNRFEQLDVLIGTKGLLPGSKIIITSKNESLTERWLFQTQAPLKHTKQTLKGLNDKESLELLSWHAFRGFDPKQYEKEELIKLVWYCQGHPLALKVLGSSLRIEGTTWEDILESLVHEFNPDIKKVLQISIDSLPNKKDKDAFMHIACIFIGKDRDFTEELLKQCGVCNSSTIRNLSKRCLLSIEDNNLYMHQLLQDIGRDMVYKESPKPWKRSLLWDHEECFDVLRNGKGSSKIRALIIDMNIFEYGTSCGLSSTNKGNSGDDAYKLFRSPTIFFHMFHLLFSIIWWLVGWVYLFCFRFQYKKGVFPTHAFGKMCNLRILQLNYVALNGSYKNFPKGLRWLCMHGFSLSYIPSDLPMENIVALDMTNSNLKHLWKKPKLLKSLKFLNLSCCRELVSVGSFCGLPTLRRLILTRCTSLVEICESIGDYCDKLEVLDLSECNKLKKLPKSMGKLKNLKELSLNGCSYVSEFPYEMTDMESLQVLKADNINKNSHVSSSAINIMETIPRSSKSFVISLPSSLVRLSLVNNNLTNESFPKNSHGLSMLNWLDLDENPIDSLPDFVTNLSRLKFLSISNCSRLTTVLCVPSTIESLYTQNCESLERITFSQETSTPPEVSFQKSESLSEIQGIFKVEGIEKIKEDILHSLGWINMKDVKDFKHTLTYTHRTLQREIRTPEMIFEHGVFSTFFEGKELPYWITHRSKGSSISITIPSWLKSCRIRGFNVCVLRALPGYFPKLLISNLTKNYYWEYIHQMHVISHAGEGMLWLCHWSFRDNEFEDGDEVSFHFDDAYIKIGVREFGISLVYDDENKKIDSLACYTSWERFACQDLSNFHATSYGWFPLLEKW